MVVQATLSDFTAKRGFGSLCESALSTLCISARHACCELRRLLMQGIPGVRRPGTFMLSAICSDVLTRPVVLKPPPATPIAPNHPPGCQSRSR